ncbi:MAG: penicillin-binding protein [Bacilli bacterium]|nr:penicillin-binding protein [Bacilli bacterium]
MAKRKININRIKSNYIMMLGILAIFIFFTLRLIYLCTVDYKVGSVTITEFIKNRNTQEEIILPKRGTIRDNKGSILAEDVVSYTIIAYLDESRSKNSETPKHVVDVDATAKILAPYVNLEEKVLKTILSKDAYQVELGPGGKNLSQIQMETIKKLNLPGIDFTQSTKRYYPNGDFASYAIGYTTKEEDKDGNIWEKGGLGTEEYFDETLRGTSGYVTYEKDRYGYKIANGREYKEDAKDGEDIYLTIDSNIELFTENATKKMAEDSEAEWGFITVADAKTGAILSYSTFPSFDPNTKEIVNYIDPLTGNPFEPGSTMKTFSYMCAIENGNYNGSNTFKSGSITYEATDGKKTTIHDWNKEGWGNISYDFGFALSSNVGASNLLETNIITKKNLTDCYNKYGFGKITDFTINRESSGRVKFNYDIDAASATFGQGITVTPIQMIKALTIIANDGRLLKPYLIDKIIDNETGESNYEATTEVLDTVASPGTINKLKELLKSVICEEKEKCTGSAYYMKDYPLMGKTGTAQIYNEKTGTYMTGESNYIYSFAGLYPIDEPQIIIYSAIKEPKDTENYIAVAIKDIVVNISKYLNIATDNNKQETYKIDNYINKDLETIKTELTKNNMQVYVLGTGDKIINQYPKENNKLYKGSVVALLTNDYDKKVPNFIGLSYKDSTNILKLMNVKYTIEGKGYVKEQSIKEGDTIKDDTTITLKLNK